MPELIKITSDLQQRALTVPIQTLKWNALNKRGIEVLVRRDDQIDGLLSGNKFYKLYYNIAAAQAAGRNQVVSFGGAYSNHLHALAAAGQRLGIKTFGVVRGEPPKTLSPTLQDAQNWGMQLHFVARDRFRTPAELNVAELLSLPPESFYTVPEGGANLAGSQGAQVIGRALELQLNGDYQQVCLACGTGTTLAGVASGLPRDKLALGFSVLKGAGRLGAEIQQRFEQLERYTQLEKYSQPQDMEHDFLRNNEDGCLGKASQQQLAPNWRLLSGFHAGGYGKKIPTALQHFWREFELETGLLLDPVYTLKVFWGIACLASANYWPRATRLVVVHTGGLQGRRGFLQQINW